ncbi:MAG: putative glycolipid-binding domain-containing protein [Acidimicrobiia bacterium]
MSEPRLVHWRGFDPDRFEAAHVTLERDSLRARGTSLTPAYSLHYEVVTGAQWVTRELALRVEGDAAVRTLALRRATDGTWATHRTGPEAESTLPLPDLSDALDCDLALCPVTNTMPILRNDLVPRARRREPGTFDYVMAWVSVPDLVVHRSEQCYSVSDPVEGGTGALVHFATEGFSTTLEVDGDSLVVNYPGLARRTETIP